MEEEDNTSLFTIHQYKTHSQFEVDEYCDTRQFIQNGHCALEFHFQVLLLSTYRVIHSFCKDYQCTLGRQQFGS